MLRASFLLVPIEADRWNRIFPTPFHSTSNAGVAAVVKYSCFLMDTIVGGSDCRPHSNLCHSDTVRISAYILLKNEGLENLVEC